MSKTPPIPAENQSPYPVQEPPHAHVEAPQGGEALAAAKEAREAKERRGRNAGQIGLSAAVGIGSAAIVAGLLYWRGGKKDPKKK